MAAAATESKKDEKAKEAPSQAASPVAQRGPQAPSGYGDEGRPDIHGWVKPDAGLVVHGKIVGMIGFIERQRDGTQKFRETIQLQLLEPLVAFKKGGESVSLVPGQVVGLSMSFALDPLRSYVTKKGSVWIQFLHKEPIGGGQTVWKAQVFCKGEKTTPIRLRAETMRSQTAEGEPTAGDDDSIPF